MLKPSVAANIHVPTKGQSYKSSRNSKPGSRKGLFGFKPLCGWEGFRPVWEDFRPYLYGYNSKSLW